MTPAEDHLADLAAEHAALRRVATLVAEQAPPTDVFAAVAEEARRILDLPLIAMSRFEPDGTVSVVGASGDHPFQPGTRWAGDGRTVSNLVLETGRPAKVDYAELPGATAEAARKAGLRTGLGVPILVDGSLWGVMVTASTADRPLPDDTETRLSAFTELVAAGISNTQSRDDLRRLAEEQAALRRVATLVASEAPPEDVFAEMAESASRVLNGPVIAMVRFEPDGTSTAIAHWGDEYPYPPGTRFPPHPGLIHEVRRTGRPARVHDYRDLPDDNSAHLTASGIRSGVAVPITVDGRPWGLIAAGSTTERPLPDDTEKRLIDFTQLLETAIANAQARDDLQRLADEQAALRRVATLIAREATPMDVFAAVAKEVAQTLHVPLTSLVRFEHGSATQVGAWGAQNPFPVGTSWPLDERSVSGRVWQTGRPARVDYDDVPGPIAATLAQRAGIISAVGVPILVEGDLWGLMMALSTAETPPPAAVEERLAGFTELVATAIANAQARDGLQQLADEQAALREVATLVARGTDASAVFDAVCAETGRLLGATSVNLVHFTADRFNLTLAGWSLRDTHVPTGTRLPLAEDTINHVIQRTAAPARVDSYADATSELGTVIRERGIRSEIGAPVIVEGQLWGALIAGTDADEPLATGTEQRITRFAELLATAIGNATTRSELIASRARIVAAADDARRRIERNLHDGTQQRLVSLGLDVQAARAKIGTDREAADAALERITREIQTVLEEVRELSRGLHPPLLAQGGLERSLRALGRRSPIPVELRVEIEQRPPESVEIAVYYVVSEALTNAAKYARASTVSVTVTSSGGVLRATVEDDGSGGAEASAGTGLVGLIDRVEALGGRFSILSPPDQGTRISIELPVTQPAADGALAFPSGRAASDRSVPVTHLSQVADAAVLLEAVATAADGLYVVDAQGRIRFLNPAAVAILGYDHERQLLGRQSHDTIHHSRPDGTPFPAAECPLLRPRVTGETVRVAEDWFVRLDGSFVPVAYSSAPIALPDGRGAVVAFRERPAAQPAR